MPHSDETWRNADGDIYFWIDQESSIHIKAVTPHSDPVELTSSEAIELGNALLAMAQQLDER